MNWLGLGFDKNYDDAHKVVLYTISEFFIFFFKFRGAGGDVKITMVEEHVYNNDTIEYDDHAYKVILYTYDYILNPKPPWMFLIIETSTPFVRGLISKKL